MERTSSQELNSLLKINGVCSFALSLGGIFLQVFLFTLGGFGAVAEYNLVAVAFIFLFFVISGWLLKRLQLKNVLLLGVAAYIAQFLLLFLFREHSLMLLIPLAILNGMGIGMFWAVMNLLQYIFTTEDVRHRYFGKQQFLSSLSGGIAPVIGGGLISFFGFAVSKTFGYSFVFFIIALLMGAVYGEAKKLPRHESIDFSLRHIMSHRRSRAWKLSLAQDFFYGLFDFMFGAFTAVLIFLVIKEEFVLGIVNAMGALVAAGAGLGASALLGKRPLSFLVASFAGAFGIMAFAAQQNWWGIGALVILFYAAMPVLTIASSKTFLDVIDRFEDPWRRKYHLFLEREIILNIGRMASLGIFLLFINEHNQLAVARIAVGLLAAIPLFAGVLQYQIMRELN